MQLVVYNIKAEYFEVLIKLNINSIATFMALVCLSPTSKAQSFDTWKQSFGLAEGSRRKLFDLTSS